MKTKKMWVHIPFVIVVFASIGYTASAKSPFRMPQTGVPQKWWTPARMTTGRRTKSNGIKDTQYFKKFHVEKKKMCVFNKEIGTLKNNRMEIKS